jgi:ribosomal protein S18 acetylase RimI-like enzyme
VSDPVLRRAVPADAAKLALLGGATFLHSFAHDHPGDAIVAHVDACHSVDWYRQLLGDPNEAAWILETELGAPVGYALLTPPALDCPTAKGDLELKRIYLLGPWQSGGWGRRLLEAVETEARARGAGRLLLCVYSVNVSAQRFYVRQGYTDTGFRQTFMVGDAAFEDFIWAKPLG